MVKVFIFHGAYGNPGENWIPWLKGELQSVGCEVYVPQFPTPEGQTLENWRKAFGIFAGKVDDNSIFVAHSIGVAFALNLIQGLGRPIRGAFFVAGFVSPAIDKHNAVTEINKTFYAKPFDWHTIRRNCRSFTVIGSDNDPYVPPALAEEVSKPLGTILTIIERAGHFNAKSGYLTFPQLRDMIEDSIAMRL